MKRTAWYVKILFQNLSVTLGFFFLLFNWFFVDFTLCILIPFISPPLYIHPLLATSPTNKIKFKGKTKDKSKNKLTYKKSHCGRCCVCDTVSHTVYPFIHITLFARVHHNESWVWIERPLAFPATSILGPHRDSS